MNRSRLSCLTFSSIFVMIAAAFGSVALGQSDGQSVERSWEAAVSEMKSSGIAMRREDTKLYLRFESDQSQIEIPRFYAALRSVTWQDGDESAIKITPEQETWRIECKRKRTQGKMLVLTFGSLPLLPSEVEPVSSQTDGSYLLPAHMATTAGEKVRFEPQSYKNTVGYWVGKQDNATWTVAVEETGKFNVAVLQGCGKGQGGSLAEMTFELKTDSTDSAAGSIEFKVLETGHFQNFQWRHLGEIELPKGVLSVQVRPKEIAKNALMDLRAIHLTRLPAAKK